MHLLDRVLRQYGYMQTIPPPSLVQDMTAFQLVNVRWVHFADNVVTALIPVVGPHACTKDYIAWYSRVSHSYLIRLDDEGDRLVVVIVIVMMTISQPPCHSSSHMLVRYFITLTFCCLITFNYLITLTFFFQGIFRRIATLLQRAISCGDTHEDTRSALEYA